MEFFSFSVAWDKNIGPRCSNESAEVSNTVVCGLEQLWRAISTQYSEQSNHPGEALRGPAESSEVSSPPQQDPRLCALPELHPETSPPCCVSSVTCSFLSEGCSHRWLSGPISTADFTQMDGKTRARLLALPTSGENYRDAESVVPTVCSFCSLQKWLSTSSAPIFKFNSNTQAGST